ncbi:MAG: pantoate--beta-alanine ligase, partial [Dehalococcoidia bacterium]|nr:pantoate--beta-alanine ligase [Dehalococcoidia bacterium]
MLRLEDPAEAERWCAARRAEGASLGFVPTMGALHEGHVSLVSRSTAENARTCVSIFVNPLQFDEEGDFVHYPRDWDADCLCLAASGRHMVFTGTLPQFFPGRLDARGRL